MIRALDVLSSFAASTARVGLGMEVGALGSRPARPLELYDFEGCPYCRKVREALSMLDLDAIVFTGGVSASFDLIEPSIRYALRERAFAPPLAAVPLLVSSLGDKAGVVGAAQLLSL